MGDAMDAPRVVLAAAPDPEVAKVVGTHREEYISERVVFQYDVRRLPARRDAGDAVALQAELLEREAQRDELLHGGLY